MTPANQMTLPEAAGVLHLPVDSVRALVGAGFLHPTAELDDGPRFALGDLKAFLARNASEPSAATGGVEQLFDELESLDPQALIDALDGRAEDMARRAYDIFAAAFPDAASWTITRQARFIEEAKARFEAILAVTAQGEPIDTSLVDDLAEVGAVAAWADTPLPEVLLVLRISRDLVVQTAVEVAEERGRHWGLALSLLLTRVLPALDRLTDSIARGYWSAVMERKEEDRARYENIVEHSSDGVYEIDLDGVIRYANRSLAVILGRRFDELHGARLGDLLGDAAAGTSREPVEVSMQRADGIVRRLSVRAVERRTSEVVVGYDGVIRDLTAAQQLEAQKNDFLALLTHELRQPLTTILGLGSTLGAYASQLGGERIEAMGETIRQQAERVARLADDLFDMSRLEFDSLIVAAREVDLASTVSAALGTIDGGDGVDVRVPKGITVLADPRRLEQVLANLVENALVHGGPPVVVEAAVGDSDVEVVVRDHGPGVAPEMEQKVFSEVRPLGGHPRRRRTDTGFGLALVRGLVEAMGGRVWYERGDEGGACFLLTVPTPAGAG